MYASKVFLRTMSSFLPFVLRTQSDTSDESWWFRYPIMVFALLLIRTPTYVHTLYPCMNAYMLRCMYVFMNVCTYAPHVHTTVSTNLSPSKLWAQCKDYWMMIRRKFYPRRLATPLIIHNTYGKLHTLY